MAVPLLCRQWKCPVCRPKMADWFQRELTTAQEAHHLDYFWTLTAGAATCNAFDSYTLVSDAWNTVCRNLARRYGSFDYVWVKAPQRNHHCHMHLLASIAVPEDDLRRRWEKASHGSDVVEVSPVRCAPAAVRYLRNNVEEFGRLRESGQWDGLRNIKSYQTSQAVTFASYRKRGEGQWAVLNLRYLDAAARLTASGLASVDAAGSVPRVTVGDADTADVWAALGVGPTLVQDQDAVEESVSLVA